MVLKHPPMGWNTWNTFGEDINEKLIMDTADIMAESGLLEAGYEYLVIDDCWAERERDPATGKIVPDKKKFPNGMKFVSEYVHKKGLKFGMYSCAGVRTCANYPGSFDHEYLDAQTFAEYGCDYLKYDYCFKPDSIDGQVLYRRMGLALRSCGRDIVFSMCNWGKDDVWSWARSAGAHLYRSTGDISDNFSSFKEIAVSQMPKLGYSATGCWNDIDMLTCGMYGKGNVALDGCSDEEYAAQFALWCIFGVPLMLGSDLRSMNEATKRLVTNRELIQIDQDPDGRPPLCLPLDQDSQERFVVFKLLSDGEYALGFFNMSDKKRMLPLYFEKLGIPFASGYGLQLTDVFTGETLEVQRECMTPLIPAHECRVYRAKMVRVAG